jgi:hypothetical protein
MLNNEVYDADVHDFDIQHSLIVIHYLVVVKTVILPRFVFIEQISRFNGLDNRNN